MPFEFPLGSPIDGDLGPVSSGADLLASFSGQDLRLGVDVACMDAALKVPDLAPDRVHQRVDLRVARHVALRQDGIAGGGRELLQVLREALHLIGEHEPRALAAHRARDAPRDRALVRDPHDQTGLAVEQQRAASGADPARPPSLTGRGIPRAEPRATREDEAREAPVVHREVDGVIICGCR